MNKILLILCMLMLFLHVRAQRNNQNEINMETLNLTEVWDKTFPKSEKVNHSKVTFINRYGITLAGDLYIPKNATEKLPTIAVCGPYGAVKEQSSGLYAQTMAERGFITLAFDPSFTGESGGNVREISSPDINTEDYSAAIDYLISRSDVDADRIGIIGICGWGGIAVSAAVQDTRIKATVSSTMGSFDDFTPEQRYEARKQINDARTLIARGERQNRQKTVPNPCPDDAPDFIKDYYNYYCTPRGYHPRSVNSGLGWEPTNWIGYFTFPLFAHADEIKSAVLLVHGEKAYSRYASEQTYKKLTGSNKQLLLIPNASHTDLYDQVNKIPFDRIENFFQENLEYLKENLKMNRTLIVYYSHTGTTKRIAQMIQQLTGADIYEMKITRKYDLDMWKANDQALEELRTGNMPELTGNLPDLTNYDTILIGGPVWGQSLSNPLRVLIPLLNLTDKCVSAFWTFEDHDEFYDATMRQSTANAKYIDGLSLPKRITNDKQLLDKAIENWIKTIKTAK